MNSSNYSSELSVYFDPSPSTPTGLSISGSSGQSPTISWNSNPEPDINAYKVYRKRIGTDNDYVLRATVNAPGTSYTDNGITIGTGRFANYVDRKSTRLNSSHIPLSRMPSSA